MRPFFLFVAFVGLIAGGARPARGQAGRTTVHGALKWGGYAEVPSQSTRKQKVPTFSESQLGLNDQVGWFSLRINGSVGQGELVNVVYEPFSAADARLFDASRLPAGPEPQLMSGTEMKRTVTHLAVRPVRRNAQTGQPERLVSFDYSYSAGPAARGTATTARTYAAHSVLRTGDWYRMGVAESGVYKLDKATLTNMGLNPAGINPNNLHIYGNSMGLLPQANATPRPDDLAENSVLFMGNADATFDDSEYFLFYSPGAHTWQAQGGQFTHRNNIYTDTTYYFVTVNGTPGKRVAAAPALTATGTTPTITTYAYRDFHEYDLVNLLHSGRQWLGEGFRSGGQQEIVLGGIPDLVTASPVRVTAAVAASSSTASSFQLTLNGAALGSQGLTALVPVAYYPVATTSTQTSQLTLTSAPADLRVGLTYSSGDPGASGYLDYLEINAQRQLRLSGAQLEFRSLANIAPQARNRYVVANATASTVVWDVTNPRRAQSRALDGSFSFVAPADTLREYVAFQPGSISNTPHAFGKSKVPNQDLHALGSQQPDLVIVTYPAFKAQAQRLAAHRQSHDNLRTAVVTTTQVYNEFSSGGQDVTAIRDLMKLVYDQSPAGKTIDLLLFGDASFDYKSDPTNEKSQEPGWWKNRVPFKSDSDFDAFNQNYVPTYESRDSFTPFYGGTVTYSSDDYYALLDDDEGEWNEVQTGNELLDIGVGRLPVRNPKGDVTSSTQARQVVDKIIGYDATAAYGKWRNRVTLVADDAEGNIFTDSSIGSDAIGNIIQVREPVYNLHKVYLDLYPQLAVAAGQRSPAANLAIDQSIEQGSLIMNYLGHGGPKGWADEQIVTNSSVLALRNPNNLVFFTTGTCDFSTYDNPDFTSGGEQALTDNTTGGAVGLFTTTRVVDAGQNAILNKKFYGRVLEPINGQMPRIGTVVMMSKNDFRLPSGGTNLTNDLNSRNYTLLADPSMTLAYPRQTVVLDSVRQRDASGKGWVQADTLQALARVRLHGKVLNNGVLNSTFTGRAQVTIYDKPTAVKTLGDENTAVQNVSIQESIVYGGQANVVNGEFSLSFVVPKDINYSSGFGKISMYAYDVSHAIDAHGYQQKQVGGASPNAPTDDAPPEIKLYMDNESFAYGGLTGQTTTLLALLSDDNGINTTGAGIGHDITAVLDHDANKLVVLNESYVSSVGDFRSGRVNNLFKDLANGPHSLTVKAWDTYNNSAEKEIEFVVAQDVKLALDHVLNYPNPFANSTTFFFDHNQAGSEPDNLEVQVQVFTVAGHLVRTLNATVSSTEAHQHSITWNGRDDYNDQLARGVYVYRLTVRSPRNNSVASKYEKLVILN